MAADYTKPNITLLFQRMGTANSGTGQRMRRMQYDLVSFGNDPEQFVCPASANKWGDYLFTSGGDPMAGGADYYNNIVDWKIFDSRPYPWHSFNDYDAANFGVSL